MTTITKSPTRKAIILKCWATAYDHEGWYPPLKDALAGLSAEEALHKTSPRAHSVRELVNHIIYYKDRFLHRQEGKEFTPEYNTNDETFTEVLKDHEGESWDAQLKRLDAVHKGIGERIANLTESDLDKPAPVEPIGAQVLNLAFHDAYHTGQIVLLRKLDGRWRN